MLKSALFIGIQRHRETFLEFHPGFNAIIGDTDSGKSALWRGFNWVRTNRPLGVEYLMNWDMKFMQVDLDFDDVGVIRRYRNKSGSKNYYQINDEEPESGFGHNPPEPILAALNIGDLNIQHQKDQFFLLNSSAPEVSRYLNKIANLEVIDRTLSTAKRDADACTAKVRKYGAEAEALEAELKTFDYLDEMEEDLTDLEGFQAQALSTGKKARHLKSAISRWESLQVEKKTLVHYLTAEDALEEIRKQYDEYLRVRGKQLGLANLITQYNALSSEKEGMPDFTQAEADLANLNKQIEELTGVGKKLLNLDRLITSHQQLVKDLHKTDLEIKEKEAGLTAKTKGLCTILEEGKCPLI